MLILPDIFKRTWGIQSNPFWPNAIREVRRQSPDFLFLAEVYWDLEWELQQQGFDFCYDKRLYDRLREGHAKPVRKHLVAGLDYQSRLARFVENHDEARAAQGFSFPKHCAAAIVTYLTPGLRFIHEGQMEGRLFRISPHLVRAPAEPINEVVQGFYQKLLAILRLPLVRQGDWRLLDSLPCENSNHSNENIVTFQWQLTEGATLLAVVNLSEKPSQAFVKLIMPNRGDSENGTLYLMEDLLNPAQTSQEHSVTPENGFRFELPGWGVSVQLLVPT